MTIEPQTKKLAKNTRHPYIGIDILTSNGTLVRPQFRKGYCDAKKILDTHTLELTY
jgi:hypothetical protein